MFILIFIAIVVVAALLFVKLEGDKAKKLKMLYGNDVKVFQLKTGYLVLTKDAKLIYIDYLSFKDKSKHKIYSSTDFNGFEIKENGSSVSSLVKTLTGDALFGIAGALTASKNQKVKVNSLELIIYINSFENNFLKLDFLRTAAFKNTLAYETAAKQLNETISTLKYFERQSNEAAR